MRILAGCWKLAAVALPILLSGAASADLIGDTIEGCVRTVASSCDQENFFVFPPPLPPIPLPTAVVVGGPNTPEFERDTGSNARRADFDGTTFRLSWEVTAGVTGFGPDTWEFTDLDYGFDIGGLQVISTTLPGSATVGAVFFDNAVQVSVANFILSAGENAHLEFQVLAPPVVPSASPPMLLLLTALLAALGLAITAHRTPPRATE